jgi:hypothetical protein
MRSNFSHHLIRLSTAALLAAIPLIMSCSEDNTLAPYEGERELSDITVENGSFVPKITWVGGYVAALGVNRGNAARLDSTLIWLVASDDDDIRFPVQFGETPAGAQDLTQQYGGQSADRLEEDNAYTFWLMKRDAWNEVAPNAGKTLMEDPTLTSALVMVENDTVFLNASIHAQLAQPLDVFINIADVRVFGRLGAIFVTEPQTSPEVVVSWQITQTEVTDSQISAIGVTEGQQFDPNTAVWEAWSEEVVNGIPEFGKNNVIASPLAIGQPLPETRIFTEFSGLDRGKFYYIWIGNQDWDGVSRLRSTNFYAFATFRTF